MRRFWKYVSLFFKVWHERIHIITLEDGESIAISGIIEPQEILFIQNLYQKGFDSGYAIGLEEGGDPLDNLI